MEYFKSSHRIPVRITIWLLLWVAVPWFSGCLYTTHHFNSGKLLDPGETSVTVGYGRTTLYDIGCEDRNASWFRDSLGLHCENTAPEDGGFRPVDSQVWIPPILMRTPLPKVSLAYRLGVRRAWGPFTGVEMGWQLEGPTNPVSVEFDLKFGLPVPDGFPFQHSLSGGWSVGMWVDNSWFSEYAACRKYGENALYANYRLTSLATQLQDLDQATAGAHFHSRRHLIQQTALGFHWTLHDWPILPDYLSPQVIATFPVVPAFISIPRRQLDAFEWNLNIGFGWNFK